MEYFIIRKVVLWEQFLCFCLSSDMELFCVCNSIPLQSDRRRTCCRQDSLSLCTSSWIRCSLKEDVWSSLLPHVASIKGMCPAVIQVRVPVKPERPAWSTQQIFSKCTFELSRSHRNKQKQKLVSIKIKWGNENAMKFRLHFNCVF